MKTSTFLLVVLMSSLVSTSYADVKLPSIFGDHMVLQQEMKIPVWGTADAGEKVNVTVGDHSASATAGADGKWRVKLDPFPNGADPVTMTVQGKNTVIFKDVLIGDVWLASGQSNMEVSVAYAYNAKDVIPKATDKQLRMFLTARKTALEPLDDVASPFAWKPAGGDKPIESDGDRPGTWIVCEPHSASNFSAVAYFFGRELRSHLNRPIGLIGSYWGGTMAEAWTSLSSLQKDPPFTSYIQAHEQNVAQFPQLNAEYEKAYPEYVKELKDYESKLNTATEQYLATAKEWQVTAKKAAAEGKPAPPKLDVRPAFPPKPKAPPRPDGGAFGPANIFNGMIAPLIPYAIKGVIWYQGESNTRNKALEYRLLFPRLIADWREKWREGDFPFLYVQISHFPYAADGSSALVREAQLQSLTVPNTGMAVTVDIPCDDAGHPHDKEDPAERLALAARHIAYGEDLVYSGPLYDSMKVEGGTIRISFKKPGDGLVIGTTPYQPSAMGSLQLTPLPTDKLAGFTIAGKDRKFVPADAKIDGDTVVVSSPQVASPAAVRFAWGDKVDCNLYNKDNLPASPFRTDEWNDFVYHDLVPGVPPPTFAPSTFPSGK